MDTQQFHDAVTVFGTVSVAFFSLLGSVLGYLSLSNRSELRVIKTRLTATEKAHAECTKDRAEQNVLLSTPVPLSDPEQLVAHMLAAKEAISRAAAQGLSAPSELTVREWATVLRHTRARHT